MSVRNNVIAVVAISFIVVGGLWAYGNLSKEGERQKEEGARNVEGILLVAQRSTFNGTNPEIRVSVNVPKKLVVVNEDAVTHDLQIKDSAGGILNVNTAPLKGGQHFNAAIVAYKPGTYEYFCSFHPGMRGKIVAEN